MFAENVSLLVAFGAGLVSFFSPCILPLIPVYIFYISGTTMAEAKTNRSRTMVRTLGFVIGFSLIFILMGSTASAIGRFLLTERVWFTRISGALLLVLGLQMLGVIHLPFLEMEKRLEGPKKKGGWPTSILIGMAFAAGWTPCFGPILASILMLAGQSDTMGHGMLLLLIYSLGMGIPFLLTAFFIDRFKGFIARNERLIRLLPKLGGIMMVLFALLLLFEQMGRVASLFG
ncbi:cytochrome c biogenesis protein CcdA [Clostridia bacterium]|nr:cytochrome c biogenesis protein CcdA [Clostridia bacterium]